MSGEDDDAGDKPFDPTPTKLRKAREKGEVPKSNDAITAAAYIGFLVACYAFGADIIGNLGSTLASLIEHSTKLTLLFDDEASPAFIGNRIMGDVAFALIPLFLLPSAMALMAIFAQRAFVVSPSKVAPKLNRLSIVQNAKNKFGRNGLFEFTKSFVKLCAFSLVLGFSLSNHLATILASTGRDPVSTVSMLMHLAGQFLIAVTLVATAIGAIDITWQHAEHIRKNRMSRKEILDETKDAEGDPHLKQERQRRAQQIARSQLITTVPDADVVIVNPTHYSVVLKWTKSPGTAPVCVAKGVDEMAAVIKKIAQENGVPIHSDPPTARAIYATVEISSEVSPELYEPVAAAIRFAQNMRAKANRGL
ncbi:MAG: EscU/YscU/HrcU family type III secretion system export apparatus switch protein [Paracoccaceae bacterium]